MSGNLDEVEQGVILAAGSGSRIFPLSQNYPKPLLPVLNKPVIEYQIEVMRKAGIGDITIVVGGLGILIKKFLGNGSKFGVKIAYIVDRNPQGIASSLMKVKNIILGRPFVLFLGDIFVYDADIKSAITLMGQVKADGIIIGRVESDPELVARNFSISTDRNGRVLRVIEKPKRPTNLFKGNGFYIFSAKIFEAIAKTSKSNLRNEVEITDSIQTLIDLGGRVYAQKWKNWDVNLSYPEDLLNCNLRMLKEQKLDNLIGEGVNINKSAQIISSVIGDRAIVDDPLVLEECLVFAGTKVKSRARQTRRLIFAKDYVVPT